MATFSGKTLSGYRIYGFKVGISGLNELVNSSDQLATINAQIFRDVEQVTQQLKNDFLINLEKYARESAFRAGNSLRKKGHINIANAVKSVLGASGANHFQIKLTVPDEEVSKYAKIYDTGGTILPINHRFLAVSTPNLKSGSIVPYYRKQNVAFHMAQAMSKKYRSITLDNDFTASSASEGMTTSVKKIIYADHRKKRTIYGLFFLADYVKVKPSRWATTALHDFTTQHAIPLLNSFGEQVVVKAVNHSKRVIK